MNSVLLSRIVAPGQIGRSRSSSRGVRSVDYCGLELGHAGVDHPGCAELVDNHAAAFGPERLLVGHANLAAVGEGVEDALAFSGSVDGDGHAKTLRLAVVVAGGIGPHDEATVLQDQARVH